MCGGVAPPPLDGPPANPAPDEGPGVLAGGGSDCSRCFSAGQLCRSMVRAQLATAHARSPRPDRPFRVFGIGRCARDTTDQCHPKVPLARDSTSPREPRSATLSPPPTRLHRGGSLARNLTRIGVLLWTDPSLVATLVEACDSSSICRPTKLDPVGVRNSADEVADLREVSPATDEVR